MKGGIIVGKIKTPGKIFSITKDARLNQLIWYLLYAVIGILFSTPTPFVAVLSYILRRPTLRP